MKDLRVRDWIETLPKTGHNSFAIDEVYSRFPTVSKLNIKSLLHRLSVKNYISCIRNGFYAFIPVEYQLKGIIPPIRYIDALMKYMERKYYVGLLSASAIYGASHNASQFFTVITELPQIQNSKKDKSIKFFSRRKVPEKFLRDVKTETGYVKVSSPELTASDLFHYSKQIGGLGNASTLLADLVEVLDFTKLDVNFFKSVSTASIQRMGYVLEEVLQNTFQADMLYQRANQSNVYFQTIILNPKSSILDKSANNRWKVVANIEIEIDE